MDSPLVSVVIPTYNRADCLVQTLNSVFAQTHRPIEVLLVDDGSTDGTRSLIESRWGGDPQLRYLYQPNRGVSAARNHGMREARGAYIALLDSDDTWMPWKLEAQLSCLAAFPDAGMIWSDMQAVDSEDRVIDPRYLRHMYDAYRWFEDEQLFSATRPVADLLVLTPELLSKAMVRYGDIFSPMLMGNLVHTSTVLLRRERYEQVRCFDESMKTGEDYDFHLRTCRAGPVVLLDGATIRYRCGRADQLSRDELLLDIARNFLRTVEPIIERDRARITLPSWMITRSLADGHQWLGATALAVGQVKEARVHLAASLRLNPWQPGTALLLADALAPIPMGRLVRKAVRQVRRTLHPSVS
jgi:glycosyltransferase involved in cell wall biosynthesis